MASENKPRLPLPVNAVDKSGRPTLATPAAEQDGRRPLQSAVALAYREGESAPKVVAKGRGLVAEQIIAVAAEHGVFVHESKELVSLLMDVDLDGQIPPLLYRTIAELLAWLYHIEEAQKAGQPLPPAPDTSAPLTEPTGGH
ncbi:EscU/YscU/HrcU family type III secretion system export apparatus switch protein [Massilia sp. BJB1822]|uniref:EscU/YscU/HrcU family type III secretion system export apparatus switch protein n=1 Tax=Massilia sp. BJB1822 TaxID=2744470 RepID=UPI001592B0F7|nr:EscU/YscU/HrcU family type III secretion system export apparatus switch protein [Massilia sp. BJB1822]NVD98337.1 EscU/YscU/HrcU family type III secretion system export apparatus switch protein [Massilia sp. BJB1822]